MKYVLILTVVAILGGVSAIDIRQDLLQHADALIRQANEALKYLESHNRVGESEAIRNDEEHLKQMIDNLKSDHSNSFQLEQKIAALEGRLSAEIRHIYRHRTNILKKRDLRDALLVRAEYVLNKGEKAIKTLKSEHKTKQAAVVEKDVAHLKKLVAELKATSKSADITHFDIEISIIEVKILEEIENVKAIETIVSGKGDLDITDLKDLILKDSAKLNASITEDINKFEAAGYKNLTVSIRKEFVHFGQLVEELKNATERDHLAKLEKDIVKSGNQMKLEIRLLKRDVEKLNELLTRSETLSKKVDDIVEKLTAKNLTSDAHILVNEKKEMQLLVEEIKSETAIIALDYLEIKLQIFEKSLKVKISIAERLLNDHHNHNHHHQQQQEQPNSRSRRDTQNDLLEKSAKILSKVREEVADLKLKGKHELVDYLEKVENMLKKLDTQIQKVDSHSMFARQALKVLEILVEKTESIVESAVNSLKK